MQSQDEAPAAKVAKRVAKIVTRELPDVATVLNGAVKEIVGNAIDVDLNPDEVEAVVKGAVKEAVKEVVSDMVQEAVGEEGEVGNEARGAVGSLIALSATGGCPTAGGGESGFRRPQGIQSPRFGLCESTQRRAVGHPSPEAHRLAASH